MPTNRSAQGVSVDRLETWDVSTSSSGLGRCKSDTMRSSCEGLYGRSAFANGHGGFSQLIGNDAVSLERQLDESGGRGEGCRGLPEHLGRDATCLAGHARQVQRRATTASCVWRVSSNCFRTGRGGLAFELITQCAAMCVG